MLFVVSKIEGFWESIDGLLTIQSFVERLLDLIDDQGANFEDFLICGSTISAASYVFGFFSNNDELDSDNE